MRPLTHAPTCVPFDLRDRIEVKLDKDESLGVIVKADEPTEWVNSIKIVEKRNGSLRIYLDPRDMKEALKREHYSCQIIEDVVVKLHGAQMFTVLNTKVVIGR